MPENEKNTFAAVIAAAGLSSRMGKFKPLLPIGNSTVIGRVITAFQNAGAEEVVVVCGHRGEELSAYVRRMGARTVLNPDYAESGMLESIRCGIEHIQTVPERIFLTPGDVPAISEQLIREMLKTDAPWLVPACSGKSAHPVLIRSALLPQIISYSGKEGLRGALENISGGEKYPWQEEAILLDADTPVDYQKLLECL